VVLGPPSEPESRLSDEPRVAVHQMRREAPTTVPQTAVAAGSYAHCEAATLAYGAGAEIISIDGRVRYLVYGDRGHLIIIGGGYSGPYAA
jgi:hypothetical protein